MTMIMKQDGIECKKIDIPLTGSCRKKVKNQSIVIIWTNLEDFESSMLYSKNQPQSFLGSGEDF